MMLIIHINASLVRILTERLSIQRPLIRSREAGTNSYRRLVLQMDKNKMVFPNQKLISFIQKYKIGKLINSCFVNFGIVFIMVNLVNIYAVVERPAFGGFKGQVIFCVVIALAITYSPWNQQKK
jgi:hypothetical protein